MSAVGHDFFSKEFSSLKLFEKTYFYLHDDGLSREVYSLSLLPQKSFSQVERTRE